jgi:hypothetical protein
MPAARRDRVAVDADFRAGAPDLKLADSVTPNLNIA